MSLFSCFFACREPQQTPPSFEAATLDPPFEHGNSGWAGVALLDYDNDGWLDIFFTNGLSQPDALYQNIGDGRFKDVAPELGIVL